MSVTCPMCRSIMVARVDFYVCCDCGCECFPNADHKANDISAIWKDEQRYKKDISSPGGGGSNGVKQKKQGTKTFVDAWKLD